MCANVLENFTMSQKFGKSHGRENIEHISCLGIPSSVVSGYNPVMVAMRRCVAIPYSPVIIDFANVCFVTRPDKSSFNIALSEEKQDLRQKEDMFVIRTYAYI